MKKQKLDKFHAHEALHTCSVMTQIVEAHLATHPYITAHPKFRKQAEAIVTKLAALYQAIGAKTL